MHRILILVAVLVALVVLVPSTTAQPPETFLMCALNSSSRAYELMVVDASGAIQKTLTSFASPTFIYDLAMAEDNSSYRVVGYRYQAPSYTGFVLDVSPAGTVTTIASGGPLVRPQRIFRSSDGDWHLLVSGMSTVNLDIVRLRGNQLTTLSTALNLYQYGAGLEPDTGQIVVRGLLRTTPIQNGYFRVDPTTGTVTTFAVYKGTTNVVSYGAKKLIHEGRSGALIDLAYDNAIQTTTMVRAHPEIGITKMPHPVLNGVGYDLLRAGQRVRTHAFYAVGQTFTAPYTYGLFRIDSTGQGQGMSTLSFTPNNVCPTVRIGSRHLSWSMNAAPNDRSLDLSFPGEGGYGYAVGFTLAGVRPGPLLSDGREIPLVADPLTVISLTGGVPGVLQNTVGVLSAQGRARVRMNLNPFGSALKGLNIWAAALVLDPRAPAAVAYIAGPTLLQVTQ